MMLCNRGGIATCTHPSCEGVVYWKSEFDLLGFSGRADIASE